MNILRTLVVPAVAALLAGCTAQTEATESSGEALTLGNACEMNAISSASVGLSTPGHLEFEAESPSSYGSPGCSDQYIFEFTSPASFANGTGGFFASPASLPTSASACAATTLTFDFYAWHQGERIGWSTVASKIVQGVWTPPSGLWQGYCSIGYSYESLPTSSSYTDYRIVVGATQYGQTLPVFLDGPGVGD